MDGKEVTSLSEISKVKTVHEMMPTNLDENLRTKGNAAKIGEEHFRVIEDCLRLDFTIREACDAAGISVPSYYHHYNKNPDFALRMDRAKNFPKQMARAAVMKRIWQGDAKTALRYLELRDKNRYNTTPGFSEEGEEESTAPVVQFISVPSDEGADQGKNDSQKSTNISSASDTSVTSSEPLTPRENEDEALRRLAS